MLPPKFRNGVAKVKFCSRMLKTAFSGVKFSIGHCTRRVCVAFSACSPLPYLLLEVLL